MCEGVRHALALIFGGFARRGEPIALPRDVYPVYWRIAAGAGVAAIGFDTFPELAHPFSTAARHVVLPCPLKLHGRAWTASGSKLRRAGSRAIRRDDSILDGVYSFGEPIARGVLELIASDQVLYLDSLSKGWLHEQVFGAAVVPARDLAVLAPIFPRRRAGATFAVRRERVARRTETGRRRDARRVARTRDRPARRARDPGPRA